MLIYTFQACSDFYFTVFYSNSIVMLIFICLKLIFSYKNGSFFNGSDDLPILTYSFQSCIKNEFKVKLNSKKFLESYDL